MNATEAKKLQKQLRREIDRAAKLAFWNEEQQTDEGLTMLERLNAAHRKVLAIDTKRELQDTLSKLEEAMR